MKLDKSLIILKILFSLHFKLRKNNCLYHHFHILMLQSYRRDAVMFILMKILWKNKKVQMKNLVLVQKKKLRINVCSNIQESSNITDSIHNWALKYNITSISLNELLSIMNRGGAAVPCDYRILLKCKTTWKILPFWVESWDCHFYKIVQENLILDFNIDGLPISKSSKSQFWPILWSIKNVMENPFRYYWNETGRTFLTRFLII